MEKSTLLWENDASELRLRGNFLEYPEAQRCECIYTGDVENGCLNSLLNHLEQLVFDQEHSVTS